MRLELVVFACAGCNGVFGIGGEVELADATYFDAPTRIPGCPPTGSGVPVFGEVVHEVKDAAGCHTYSIATDGTQMAICPSSTAAMSVWVGEPNAALAQLDLSAEYTGFYDARLSGDGSLAIIQAATNTGQQVAFAMHHDSTAHTWTTLAGTVPTTNGTIASPSSGPPYDLIYFYDDADIGYALYELTGDGTAWSAVASYTALGAMLVDSATMTPDGLHLVAAANALAAGHIVYSDRATTSDHFTAFRVFDTVPSMIFDPFLTADCERLYFSALGRVLYLEQ